jgi:putative flavoprotein involved in K+ transport
MSDQEYVETVVIGGGQAGLAVGYELRKRHREFVILDAHPRVGDAWRRRWDSLLLFTPTQFVNMPGMKHPPTKAPFLTKDDMADFLETYAQRFALPVRTNTRVERVARDGDRLVVEAAGTTLAAANVVVAMADFQQPKVPAFAGALDPGIVQMHSHEYKNPSQLRDGPVLVVGVGNSGADIAIEVAKHHPTWLAGKESAAIPFRIEPWFARHVAFPVVRFLFHHVFTDRSPIGRKVRPSFLEHAAPLIRVKPKDFDAAGITRIGRVVGAQDGRPVSEEGNCIDVANVIWCTGYRPGFSWIDLPVLGDNQHPRHARGIVRDQPGLYFVGLEFIYAASSATIIGVGRDARRVVRHLAARSVSRKPVLPVRAAAAS